MLPSALSRSDWFSLGACWAFSFQPVLPSVWRPVVSLKSRTWARRLTQSRNSALAFVSPCWNGSVFLRGRCYCRCAIVVQGFVHFSAHPEVMQQHRQLSRGRHDGSLLSVSPATLGQLQAPAPQITVHPEWSQNVLRSLHQQRAQVRVAFLADVHLRLAPPGVPPSRLQSQIAAHVPALAKAMRIFQGQQKRQPDERAYSLHLLQQCHLRITVLRQFFDALVVLANLLTHRFDAPQQRLQRHLQLRTQAFGFLRIHIPHVASAPTRCSSCICPDSSSTQYQLLRSPRSNPTVNFC